MTLSNLIDLIAEVAAKRTAREAKTKEETSVQAPYWWRAIVAILRRVADLITTVVAIHAEAVIVTAGR